MRVPISWLKDYVDFNDTPQGLAQKLTLSGTEVEGIETIGSTYDGIVVGEVLKVDKHPNADKLTLCTVNTGSGEMTVVCGAPNVKPGIKAPFARVGVTLANGMKLKAAKIRGVESQGMLCAEDELGISADHSGLLILDAKWPAGTPLSTVLGPPETVLELEITPNRPDCLSVIGIAREVAALYGTEVRWPPIKPAESDPAVETLTRVEIEDTDGCPRYTARVLTGVKLGPAPDWMRKRLELSGVRPISNVVDITNYVMLECGQPLHAFDQKLLDGGRIVVRRFRAGEKLSTLDGIERPMSPQMLVIADAKRPVAVAGVMGGAGSEINDRTSTVLLESAYFKPQDNRATSKKLGLSTESSYRFERGIDIGTVEWASRRAAALMQEHAGAALARGVIDVYPKPRTEQTIVCRYERVRSLLGLDLAAAQITKVLESLGLSVTESVEKSCTVKIPTFRVDLEAEVDLIEEVARIHGLDKLPAPSPRAEVVPGADDRPTRAEIVCRNNLVGLGLREVMNYSFVADKLLDLLNPLDADQRVVLPNPVNLEQGTLRNALTPQMVETLGRNLAHQQTEAAFFELGRVFFLNAEGRPDEESRLAIGLMGPVGRTGMDRHRGVQPDEMFLWIKGIWEQLARAQGIARWELIETTRSHLEAGRAAALIVAGQDIGVLGLLKSAIRKEWRITGPAAVLEIRTAPLLEHVFDSQSFAALAQYPSVVRDAALIVGEGVRHEDVLNVVKKAAPKELERVELFDIFSGEGIGAGRKSLAYSFTYRSLTRTLTDEDANGYHEQVKDALKRELGVEVREG
ncbi:MAG: phenylalanine--tRNA ligase subunit beta [Verrucomicrobia bacterium A1]|nr:MAG: phenylalanine--tRNA ligase subunit beta [Verrucomicrobia bacterium A1]